MGITGESFSGMESVYFSIHTAECLTCERIAGARAGAGQQVAYCSIAE
jgi:hypothetical protein